MRLSPEQVAVIRQGVNRLAGDSARVWLFGSRVRDEERGGDVDLLLELDGPVEEPAGPAALMMAAALAARLEFLLRLTEKECGHLLDTDARLFAIPFTVEEARRITADPGWPSASMRSWAALAACRTPWATNCSRPC